MPSFALVTLAIEVYKRETPQSNFPSVAQLLTVAIVTYVLAVVAVALRFWARRLMKAQIWVDDWTAAVALLIATGFFVNAIVWFQQVFAHYHGSFGEDYLKAIFLEQVLYIIVIGLVKYSILAFYWRLFGASIRIPCYILGAITTCWGIATILATVFQCVPVSGFWHNKISAKCINGQSVFIGSLVPHISTDLALLFLPVPYIWRLHRTTSQKIALAGIFMLGGVVNVISIIRLTILLSQKDLSLAIWSIGESNTAIVAACLPSLRPILSLILYGEPSVSMRGSRGTVFGRFWTRIRPVAVTQTHGQPTSPSNNQHNFMPLPDEAYGFSGIEPLHGTAVLCSGERQTHDHEDIEMQTGGRWAKGGIQVRSDVIISSTQDKRAADSGYVS
ncbi:MAG: hypothetical protein ASARMPRED_008661 [Alectoria sarmentosa]|nr:MAG: hypothetical protein ASARMPRED_008661 [Alectoria sarmentosa]